MWLRVIPGVSRCSRVAPLLQFRRRFCGELAKKKALKVLSRCAVDYNSHNQISIYCKDIWNHFIKWFLSFYELLWREAVSWSSISIAVTTWMDLCSLFTHPATLKDRKGRNYRTRPCIGGHNYVHINIYYFMKSIENKHYRGYVIINIISNNNINDWKGKYNETVPLLLHHVVIITMKIIKLYCCGVNCISLRQCSLYYYFSTLLSGSLLKGSSPFQISIGALLDNKAPKPSVDLQKTAYLQ